MQVGDLSAAQTVPRRLGLECGLVVSAKRWGSQWFQRDSTIDLGDCLIRGVGCRPTRR